MQKLCLSTKFTYQEIKWNYSILRSVWKFATLDCMISSLTKNLIKQKIDGGKGEIWKKKSASIVDRWGKIVKSNWL